MAKIFPNNPEKQVWGNIQKGYKTLTSAAFVQEEREQPKTEQEIKQALLDKLKPYSADDLKKYKVIQAKGAVETPAPPPVETFYLTTEASEPLLTEAGDNILYD